jgi:hypothetical protein
MLHKERKLEYLAKNLVSESGMLIKLSLGKTLVCGKFTVVDMKGMHIVLWSLEALYVVTGESHHSCVPIIHTCLFTGILV